MKEAKPIFLIGLPKDSTPEDHMEILESTKRTFPDYNTAVYSHTGQEIEFKAFYPKDFDEVKLEEVQTYFIKELTNQHKENGKSN